MDDLLKRFLSHVQKTETCWIWTGYTINGYGMITIDGKNERAHRISWKLFKGEIDPTKRVLHTCDNRLCVNPEHLYQDTQAINIQEMYSKRRSPNVKLSQDQVSEIRSSKDSRKILSKKFGVSVVQIGRIQTCACWWYM